MHRLAALALVSLVLPGCASLIRPSDAELAQLPVVRFGDAAPAGQPYILHYPAGAPLPVEARIHGSLMEQDTRSTLQVSIRKDIYTYKQWASLDGKTWCRATDLIGGHFQFVVPGEGDSRAPGVMRAEFNLKP